MNLFLDFLCGKMSRPASSRKPKAVRLALESLEDRMVPSTLLIRGNKIEISTNDGTLEFKVDNKYSRVATNTVSGIQVNGLGANSYLKIYDRNASSPGFANYGLGIGSVSVNSLKIKYDTGIQDLQLHTSYLVPNSVQITATDSRTRPTIYCDDSYGLAPTTISAYFSSSATNHLASDIHVYGGSNTTVDTFDYYMATPTFNVNESSVTEEGISGGLIYGDNPYVPSSGHLGSVRVHANDGTDRLHVLATGLTPVTLFGAPVTLFGGFGSTSFEVGNQFGTDMIHGNVTVQGGSGQSALTIDDQRGSASQQTWKLYTVNDHNIDFGQSGTVSYSGVGKVNLRTIDTSAWLNNPLRAQVYVDGSAAGTPIEIDAGGGPTDVTANFESSGGQQLLGDLSVIGNANTSLATYDSWSANTYTIRDGSVAQAGRGTVSYSGLSGLSVTGIQGDVFRILGTTAGVVTDVREFSGNGQFIVGGEDGTLDSIQGPLHLHGGKGIPSQVTFDDSANGNPQTYDFSTIQPMGFLPVMSQVTRDGIATITVDKMSQVGLNVSTVAPSTVIVEELPAGALLTLGVNSGTAVNFGKPLGDGTATLAGILGDVFLNASNGSPTVVLDNSGDTTAHDLTAVNEGADIKLQGLTPGSLFFSNVPSANVQVLPGSGAITGLDDFFALLG
jgi:hypothetical protein